MSLLSRLDDYTYSRIYHYVFKACLKEIIPTHIDDGDFYWTAQRGPLHRKIGPAVIYENGNQLWYRNGRRVDPPTILRL